MKQVTIRPAQRNESIAPFHVMALLERAQALEALGCDVIHLEVGEPDFATPPPILHAGQQALAADRTRYSAAAGLPQLREKIAGWYQQTFGVTISAQRIVVTPGASGALQLALAVLVNPGDGVLVTDPGYPCNRHFLELVNGQAQRLTLSPQNGMCVSAEQIAAHWQGNTVAALLASPDNPTGTVLTLAQMEAIAEAIAERDGMLIMDEIYQGFCYDHPPHSVLQVAPQALVVNSFSKFFGMTGWRLGWLVAPEALVPAIERMAQNFFLAAPTVSQHAALAAFETATLDELERRRKTLAARRAYLLSALPALGFAVVGQPDGAFYLYLDVSAITENSDDWCLRLLEEKHVALTPGKDFGAQHGPHRYVRLAYTAELERLKEAVARIAAFIQEGVDANADGVASGVLTSKGRSE